MSPEEFIKHNVTWVPSIADVFADDWEIVL